MELIRARTVPSLYAAAQRGCNPHVTWRLSRSSMISMPGWRRSARRSSRLSAYFSLPHVWPCPRKPPLSEASCLWNPGQKNPRPSPALLRLGGAISKGLSSNRTSQLSNQPQSQASRSSKSKPYTPIAPVMRRQRMGLANVGYRA